MSSLYPTKKKAPEIHTTEFDILKSAHRFLRSNDDPKARQSWETQLAKKYEDSLFKEFAVCDLKHYKSGNIALRWRTEDEVLSGAGETTCGNTRCPYHERFTKESLELNSKLESPPAKLTTVELPFAYIEQGETTPNQALVKVVLCSRCLKKILWKREKDKRKKDGRDKEAGNDAEDKAMVEAGPSKKRDSRTRREDHRPRSRSRSPKRRA